MIKGLFSKTSHASNLFIIIFVILITFIITNVIGFILSVFIFNISFSDLLNAFKNLNYYNHAIINILKYFQMIQTIGLFIIPPLLLAWLFSEKSTLDYLNINKNAGLLTFFLAACIMYACMPLIEWMVQINTSFINHHLPSINYKLYTMFKESEDNADKLTKAFLSVTTCKGLTLNIIMIGLLPAIGEEFMFRGLLITFFIRFFNSKFKIQNSKFLAIIISAVIFSAIHLQFYGFLPRMMLGILFGYLFVWSGSLWVPIFVHFLNNSTAVIASYMQSKGLIKIDVDKMFSFDNEYRYIIMSAIASIILIWLFHFYSSRKPTPPKLNLN